MGTHTAAMKVVVRPLQECALGGLAVTTGKNIEWNCVPSLTSYCRRIPERKDVAAVRHGVAVCRLFA